MAIVVNVEQYCIFKLNEKNLKGGHNGDMCPQCKALRKCVIDINSETLDRISEIFRKMPEGTSLEVKSAIAAIDGLKVRR